MDIRSFIVHTLGVESDDIDQVVPYFELRHYSKNEFILDSGDVCTDVFFLVQGCVINRIELSSGYPMLKEIITPNMWFSDLKSFQQQIPGNQCLECLTPSSAYTLNRVHFEQLEKKFPNFSKVARLIFTEVNQQLEERIVRLKQLDALNRWNWFQEQSRLVQLQLPKKLISEYLDMRPETLSRILDNPNT